MKKTFITLLITALAFFGIVISVGIFTRDQKDEFKIAMVTDFSDVNDASFNQACYEGAKEWSKQYNIKFNYYKPAGTTDPERIKALTLAIDRGYDVILCPGFALAKPIAKVAPNHPNVKFLGLDISQGDFGDFTLTDNICVFNYQEEKAGYLAGYAAVKEGYRRLGYLGGLMIDPVMRFGYGYVQGISDAAKEIDENVLIKYSYGGQFFGDSEIYKAVDAWYKPNNNVEVVFACGGSIYTSVALAAKENGGKMIGVDSDQAPIIDRDYGEDICITSAMKAMKQTVIDKLEALYKSGTWAKGEIIELGLVSSEEPEHNYVQLPLNDWRLDNFSIDEYKQLIKEIIDGTRIVNSKLPETPPYDSEHVTLDYKEKIK